MDGFEEPLQPRQPGIHDGLLLNRLNRLFQVNGLFQLMKLVQLKKLVQLNKLVQWRGRFQVRGLFEVRVFPVKGRLQEQGLLEKPYSFFFGVGLPVLPAVWNHGWRRCVLGERVEKFGAGLFERKAAAGRRLRGRHGPRNLIDGLLEIGIVTRDDERALVERERLIELAAPVMDFGHAPDGRQVFRGVLKHVQQLHLRLFERIQLDERSAERNASG